MAGAAHPSSSLYVGDLDESVTDAQLYDLFNQVAPVISLRLCRDYHTSRSLRYAYVNFSNPSDAGNAMNVLNFTPINGRPIRIMLSNRDPSLRKSGKGNLYIKNLDQSIDIKALHDNFAAFGPILSCKLAVDQNGQSRGFGFVQFYNEEDAQSAIDKLNGMLLNDKRVFVGFFVRRQERAQAKFTNVYVKNLPKETTDDELKVIFSRHGTVTSAIVVKDQNGNSKHFGFVNFETPEAAADAVAKMHGINLGDEKLLYVGRAQKKSEREAELRAKFEEEKLSRYKKQQGANLYLKNLDESINDEKLIDLFSQFGAITSSKVMVNSQGVSKGSGFVSFSSREEALRALNEMRGKMIGRKPLYVAVAQRKDERRARLQALFSQIQAPSPTSRLPSGIPGYHPGAQTAVPQQMYFGQVTSDSITSQPIGYGFQQQFFTIRGQAQPGQRTGFGHGGNAQQQFLYRNSNQGFQYMGNGRSPMDLSVTKSLSAPVPSLDLEQKGHSPILKLTSALASASPNDRTRMLGEQLYSLVEKHEPVHVAKVTGMLLEMDQAEILHLLDSPDALKEKVDEAMEVLRRSVAIESEVDDQPGFSSTK